MNNRIIKSMVVLVAVAVTFLVQPSSSITAKAETVVEAVKSNANTQAIDKETPSGIKYEDLQKEVDLFIEERKEGCASVSVAVFERNATLYSTQYGYSDIENKVQVNEDTVYEWGSVSKLLVWTCVMQLFEQEKIDLNTDIREYLPEGFLKKLSFDKPITMTNLMNHNAGWQETTYDVEVSDVSDIVDLETALRMSQPAQIYEPGTVTAYSNWGTALAAFIVQHVSGENYVTYVHKNILVPLGMEHTSIGSDYSDNEWVKNQRELLNCYLIMQDYYEEYGTAIGYILLYPAGSATGTLNDFTTFAKAFVPGEGEKCSLFEKQETLELMKEATSYYGDSDIARNCHGFWTLQYTVDVKGHNGNTKGCTSTLMFEPKSGLGVVVMTNEMGETAYNYGILSLLYGDYSENVRVKGNSFSTSTDLSGIYTLSRTYKKGFGAIYKYMGSLMLLSKTEDENRFKLTIGQGNLKKVAKNQYIMDNENGWRYLMYETVGTDGQTVLQMMSADVVKENTVSFGLRIASLILFVIVVLVSMVIGLMKFIILIIRKIRRKKPMSENKELRKMHTIMAIVNSVIGVVFYVLIVLPLDGGSVKIIPVMIQCMILGIASLASIINVGITFKHWKDCDLTKRNKVKYISMVVSSCCLSGFIWYWQLFNFWSC